MVKHTHPAIRARLGILVSAAAVLLMTGCSGLDPVPGAQPPKDGEVQFTSDSGLITINIPSSWEDGTAAFRDYYGGPDANEIDAVFFFNGIPFKGASSVILQMEEDTGIRSLATKSNWEFGQSRDFSDGEVVVRDTLETTGGIVFERQDIDNSSPGSPRYNAEFVAVLDEWNILINVNIFREDYQYLLDDALAAIDTLVVRQD